MEMTFLNNHASWGKPLSFILSGTPSCWGWQPWETVATFMFCLCSFSEHFVWPQRMPDQMALMVISTSTRPCTTPCFLRIKLSTLCLVLVGLGQKNTQPTSVHFAKLLGFKPEVQNIKHLGFHNNKSNKTATGQQLNLGLFPAAADYFVNSINNPNSLITGGDGDAVLSVKYHKSGHVRFFKGLQEKHYGT